MNKSKFCGVSKQDVMKKKTNYSLLRCFALIAVCLFLHESIYAQTGGAIYQAGPQMNRTRIYPLTAILNDGRIAVFGGREVGFNPCAYADFYNPGTNTFTEIPMNFPHDYSCIVKLFDGRYYIIGGSLSLGVPAYSSCEIFNPADNSFTTAGSMAYARASMSAAQLNNGNVLIAGAWYDATAGSIAEYYDTTSHAYTTTNPMMQACALPLLLPTSDGGAVAIGGTPVYGGTAYTRVEYYNPADNSFHSLTSEVIPADPGWLVTGFPYHDRPYADYKMNDGNYLVAATRTGEFGLLSFNPTSKSFTHINTSSPIMDSYSDGGFYDIVLDKAHNVVYLLGIKSGTDPIQLSLIAVNLTTGFVFHPASNFTLPAGEYPMPTLAFIPSNGKILLTGISSAGSDYFHATDKSYVITPTSPLETPVITEVSEEVTIFPNPAYDVLTVQCDDATAATEVYISDLMGRIVTRGKFGNGNIIQIQTGHLPTGVYFCEVKNNGTITRTRFIRQ